MGIIVEFNPDLALRNILEFKSGNRKIEKCIPEPLEEGNVYNFLKKDQRNYYLHGEIPLLETEGNGILSEPIASIIILESTHFIENGKIYTKGRYKVIKIIPKNKIYFNGFNKVKNKL
ncbi:MAG: hypothetical protein A2312_00715 [Candidatus Staskawiczbacteria bacterium RIFOXYB2_FULL_32_9]|uniref:Uncharacterized protein n=1 Tax=Candidatus Staskawiczbacteria bacterium RIFOXYD1_FULL_32_13 TaxID=1802234 RepID=A0A1G2JMF4_9BACT|nr:MAG: hypothetical protein UR22_C0004G0016 [Parcubacteria group bacterium GW2011_GWC2_32_10]OGZ79293.1 MAG: hypothetical protein A2360_01210 [Candidatus Staskawiczbacteria bacterium RIFOXYB1_FULL_32_11]OGZ79834.1 MAG: hypothetical protein A2256_02635 [Candidatus Staskawiczbacteria bacterium RIFOXYA2_FULL_32_7]OGZ84599.1 MAG: hypothetical protein A2312_00715 [Candidatus Staskawiczbacteria bacterium RIFOXYB2_FULL_32_9]OGZ88035.1 MAG: hypothetical protein A2463_00295 [Candidatus Staskawiczbacter